MFYNSQGYAVDEYNDFVVEERLKVARFNLEVNLYYSYGLTYHTLDDMRDLYSLGFGGDDHYY